ncbi:MAG TPA: TetR/AcrR family transcriptional regulator [Candidatus Binatia bacterium]|nr:TetR/AcrR family transcriptional regulator [Candidatus Binatia bacterium]
MSNLTARSIRTRADILDVAWRVIAERGAHVSMSEIADAVGLTRQAIYVHFRSRGGLLVALVRRADERADIHTQFRDALATADPRQRLDAFLRVWLDFVPTIHPVATSLMRARRDDPDAAQAWADRMDALHHGFALLAKSLRRDGALAPQWTAPAAADFLWAGSSVQVWELLAVARGWGAAKTARTLRQTLTAAVLG